MADIDSLLTEAQALCADSRFSGMLKAHWLQLHSTSPGPGRTSRLSTRIHSNDQMLLHSLRHHRDASAAVSQYYNVALQQYQAMRQILDIVLPAHVGRVNVLDFACGFGRMVRFLSCCARDVDISVSEIQDDALVFVADEFGVHPVRSSMRPEGFSPDKRFDFIWVASLFSHLPEPLFHGWLKRLMSTLSDRGVLCFSVHDEVLAPAELDFPASGLLFRPQSENADLDTQSYGTTYVAESFVRAAVVRAAGGARHIHRLRKALAHEQDVYVVAADPGRQLSALRAFRRGPWGWVDERRVDASTLRLSGWAASLDDGVLPEVTIRVDGEIHRCPTGGLRPDVQTVFDDARLASSGWTLELALDPGSTQPWVEVTAHTAVGESALLYAGLPAGRSATRPVPSEAPVTGRPQAHVYARDVDADVRSSLSVLAALVAPGSSVLDVGTGSGALGRLLRSARACRVDGLTHNPAERDAASAWYERIEVVDLEDEDWHQRFAGREYDYIVFGDVLEHLREPERVLTSCRELLRADGWLLASVPNACYAGMVVELMHGDWNYGPEGLLDRTHLRFFTRRSFQRLLEMQGWRVERVEPIELTWYYTEFWTPFDRLPPAVARYLLAQPDASAYQLVFAACRADSVGRPLSTEGPATDPAIAVAVYASTLHLTTMDRRPLHSLPALGRVGAEGQRLRFTIPADIELPAQVHWSAADRPGFMRVRSIHLWDRHMGPVWAWHAQRDGDATLRQAARSQIELGDGPYGAHDVSLLLTGDNPQLELLQIARSLQRGSGPWTLDIVCGWPLSADYLALLPGAGSAPLPGASETVVGSSAPSGPNAIDGDRDDMIEVIVPVHGSLSDVQRCLRSVLASAGQCRWHLTVIDDASPQPEVGRWLRELAHLHPDITVVTNARNLGFVASVNLGMRMAGRRDVVLLNSDTEVAGDWLDRLRRAALSAETVGTATPFSNNATICSFPKFCEPNALPAGHTTATLDRLFARTHVCRTIDIPTAVGFCMYIRRKCLDEIGEFDARTFGAGYGEENDFCMRASAKGWRHVHALDVFVFHAGGSSFGNRQQDLQASAIAAIRRLHPDYEAIVRDFVSRDPARLLRESLVRLSDASAIKSDASATREGN